ncbi:uncharacterized protein LOC131672637 [Phymastichus coffea]|uniref:uncharacterized protein LOC131672637 n=1 Tax=Phymastichus coffea TaxID=108790 RepID=UPI00273ABE83|nr:uncharacterized protein LOC131672637 [Phymastichus coffea]
MLRSVYLLRCTACVNTYRKFIKTLCTESFQSRTLKYFKSTSELQKPLQYTSELSDECFDSLFPRAQKTLETVYSDFKKVQNTNDEVLRNAILDDIDSKCFSIVHVLKPYQIFDLLYNFHQVYSNRIQITYFYEKAISNLVEAVENRTLNDKEIIQLLFYMSFNKEMAQCYIGDIRPHLTDIKKLSLFEKCVVADCFIKVNVKFTPSESEEFEKIIEDQFEALKKEPHLLIIACKALTLISTKEVLTFKKLTNAIVYAEEPWNFKILVNMLSLYSRALLFEPRVIDILVKEGIEALKEDLKCNTFQLELYDISKFIRSLSILSLTLSSKDKIVFKTIVEKRYEEYKKIKNLSLFVGDLLCLHVLQCWSKKVLLNSFRDYVFEPIYHNRYLWKIETRLKLLITQINLEMKIKTPKSLNRPIVTKVTPSMNVIELEEICKQLINDKIVDSVNIECPIEALFIPGVTLRIKDMVYHVDILDNVSCLKNTNVPHGYMNLKLRLLHRLQIRYILIQENLLKKPQKVLQTITDKINYSQAPTFRHILPKFMQEYDSMTRKIISMLKIIQLLFIKNTFISKPLTCHYSIRFGYKPSLQYKILNYFQNIDDARKVSEQCAVSAQLQKEINKNNFSQEKFQFIHQQINYLSNGCKIRQEIVNEIDHKCLKLIDSLTYSEIFMLLSLLLKIFTYNTLTKTQFYETSMDILFQLLECELLSHQEIIQLLFFISLKKDKAKSYIEYLKLFLPDIKYMDLIEKCITAEAFYKSSVKLNQSQCRVLEDLLSEKSQELISNSILLVPLCKVIRLSKPTSQLNLTNLSNVILSQIKPFNITTTVHILSLYAEALLNEPVVTARLIRDCMQTIAQNRRNLRLKDLDRFLWSISHLGFSIERDEKLMLLKVIEKRLEELKNKENVGLLVNSLLSLHILECWSPKILENCFTESVFEPIFYDKFHWKIRSRLHLLIQQISIEMDLDIPVILKKQIQVTYTVPEEVNFVAKILNILIEKNIVEGILIHCPVKGLQIPGISLVTETWYIHYGFSAFIFLLTVNIIINLSFSLYHIDLLNNSTCLRNTSIPHGLMQLKLRLLTYLKFHHILIPGDLVTTNSDKILSIVQEQVYENKI